MTKASPKTEKGSVLWWEQPRVTALGTPAATPTS